jgi:hypothetical protein
VLLAPDPQAAAYERLLPRIVAVPKHRLRPLNVDVSTIASRIYGAVRHFPTFAETLAKLPDYRFDVVAELRDLVGALLYVDSLVRITHASVGALPELLARAMQLRELLIADVHTLIARKVLPPESLDHLTGRTGAVRVGGDLGVLGAIFAKSWDRIEGRCGTTKEEVHEANRLSTALTMAAAERSNADRPRKEVVRIRVQTFTLVVDAYNEYRRGMHFLRAPYGDGERLVPSLWKGRGGRGKKAAEPAEHASER